MKFIKSLCLDKKTFLLFLLTSLVLICSIVAIVVLSNYIHGFDPAWSFLTIEAAIVWLIVSCLLFLGSCLLIVTLLIRRFKNNGSIGSGHK